MSTKALDFIEMLFTAISEDSSIPSEVKPYLMGMQIPLIKVSEDKTLFTEATHPARICLMLLTKISSSGKNIREISIKISQITDNLIHVEDIDKQSFIIANRELLKIINEEDKNKIIRLYEEQDREKNKKDKADEIKQLVITELQEIISDNSIPILAHELTLKIWPQFMFQKCVAHGTNSAYWIEGIQKFKRIIEYVQPVKSLEQWYSLNNDYESFVDSVNVLLNDSTINKNRITINTDALRKAITVNINQYRNDNSDLFISSEKKKEELNSEEDVIAKKLNMLPESVKVGEWYDLFTADDRAANRLMLSLIVEDKAKLIFVDHRGIKGMVKDADVFAEELSRFLSRPVNATKPRFADTWNELIEKIPRFNRHD